MKGWLVAFGCVAAYGLATMVPVPGVDQDALAAMTQSSGGLLGLFDTTAPFVSPFGGMLLWLVVGRAIVRAAASDPASHSPWAARIVFALFVLLAVMRGFGIALYLESAGDGSFEVVTAPGWAFRLMAVASFGAAAAITWMIATWISQTRVAQGPLLLYGGSLVASVAIDGMELGRGLAMGQRTPFEVLVHLATLLPFVIVLGALSFRPPVRWPLPIARGLVLSSPADALVFPYLSGLALSSVTFLGPTLALPGSSCLPYLALVLEVGLALGLVVWLTRVPSRAGAARRYLVVAVLAFPVALATVGVGTALHVASGGALAGIFAPAGPFAGDERYHVEAVSRVGAAAADAPIVSRRLRELGVDADVEPVGRDRLRIEIRGVRSGREAMSTALRTSLVTFRLVAVDQGALAPQPGDSPPEGVQIDSVHAGMERFVVFVAASPNALEPVLARPGVDRTEVAIECTSSEERSRRCVPWRLEPATIDSRDIEEASVQIDPQTNSPYVSVGFSEDAARRFDEVTARSIDRRLAICVDDSIMSAPVIRSRIPGGRAQITLGSMRSFEEVHREASGLVAALRTGALHGAWTVETMTAAPGR